MRIGGLAVGNILEKNLAFLRKWWQRFAREKEPLWKKVLLSIEGFQSMKAFVENFSHWKSQLQKGICGITKNGNIEKIMNEGIQNIVGEGNTTRFWIHWVGNDTLRKRFPRLFKITTDKNALISDMWAWDGEVWLWHTPQRRWLFMWEREWNNS